MGNSGSSKGKQLVGCKRVFTMKHKVDGSLEQIKARLVAKGYTQECFLAWWPKRRNVYGAYLRILIGIRFAD